MVTDLARWVGELLIGRGLPMRLVLLRVLLLGCAAVLLMAAGVHALFAESGEGPSAGGRLWQGLVLLSVVLAIRALFEVWELDGGLAAAAAGALVFGGMGWAAAQNALETRAWAFGGAASALLAVAVWRGIVAARREDAWARARAERIASEATASAPAKKRRKRRE